MKIAKLLAPLAALVAVAACAAPTESTAPKDVYYATPEVAASLTPDRITLVEPGEGAATTPSADQRAYFLGEGGFTPASDEDLEGLKTDAVIQCHLCLPNGQCLPICCVGQPHCLPYKV